MTEPIDKSSIPISSTIARWSLVLAIFALVAAVYSGFGSLACICAKLEEISKGLTGIADRIATGGHGPGGGAGTIGLGTGGGGGGSVTTMWVVTESSTPGSRPATIGDSLTIRADAFGKINIFEARPSATNVFVSLKRYVAKIRPTGSAEDLTLRVERDFLNNLHWTLEKPDGTMLTIVPCQSGSCTGDLPKEFFGTLVSLSAQPIAGAIVTGNVTVRSQTQ